VDERGAWAGITRDAIAVDLILGRDLRFSGSPTPEFAPFWRRGSKRENEKTRGLSVSGKRA